MIGAGDQAFMSSSNGKEVLCACIYTVLKRMCNEIFDLHVCI